MSTGLMCWHIVLALRQQVADARSLRNRLGCVMVSVFVAKEIEKLDVGRRVGLGWRMNNRRRRGRLAADRCAPSYL